LGRERHRHAAVRIEVLERDRGGVRAVNLVEGWPAIQADPLKIGIEVEHRPAQYAGRTIRRSGGAVTRPAGRAPCPRAAACAAPARRPDLPPGRAWPAPRSRRPSTPGY